VGDEIKEFRPYWPNGDVYINPDRSIYRAIGGGQLRKLSLAQLISPKAIMGAYKQTWNSIRSGEVTGNLHKGNGFLLGGVMVTDQKKRLLYQWQQDYNTLANTDEIHEAAKKIKSSL